MKNIVIRRVGLIHFQLSFPALQISNEFDEEAVKFVYVPRPLFIYSFVNISMAENFQPGTSDGPWLHSVFGSAYDVCSPYPWGSLRQFPIIVGYQFHSLHMFCQHRIECYPVPITTARLYAIPLNLLRYPKSVSKHCQIHPAAGTLITPNSYLGNAKLCFA